MKTIQKLGQRRYPSSLTQAMTRSFATETKINEPLDFDPNTTGSPLPSVQTWGGLAFSAVQSTLSAASDVKDFLFPEDLKPIKTNEEVVQELLRSTALAKQTMKSVAQKVDFYTNAYTQSTDDEKYLDELRTIEEK